MIEGMIKGQKLRLSYPTVVADTLDYLKASFLFLSPEWTGLSKWVHFKNGDRVFTVALSDGQILAKDHLNLSEGIWTVYIHGERIENGEVVSRITTNSDMLLVEACGVLDGEPLPLTPPSVGEQILAKAEEALVMANRVRVETTETLDELYGDMDKALSAILAEQRSILAIQDALIGGGV